MFILEFFGVREGKIFNGLHFTKNKRKSMRISAYHAREYSSNFIFGRLKQSFEEDYKSLVDFEFVRI